MQKTQWHLRRYKKSLSKISLKSKSECSKNARIHTKQKTWKSLFSFRLLSSFLPVHETTPFVCVSVRNTYCLFIIQYIYRWRTQNSAAADIFYYKWIWVCCWASFSDWCVECVCITQMYYYKLYVPGHLIPPPSTKTSTYTNTSKTFSSFSTISPLFPPQTIILSAWILFNLLLSEKENYIKWKHEIKRV